MQVERIVGYIIQGDMRALYRENHFLVQAKGREALRLYDPSINYPEKLAQQLNRENGNWLLYVAVAHGDVDLFHHLCERWYNGVLVTSLLLPLADERLEIVYYLLARMQRQTLLRRDILQNTHLALTCAVVKGNKSVFAALCYADLGSSDDQEKIITLVVDSYRDLVPTLLANGSPRFLRDAAAVAHALGDQAMFLATFTNPRVNKQIPKCLLLVCFDEGILPELWKYICALLLQISFRSCVANPELRVASAAQFYSKRWSLMHRHARSLLSD